MCNLFSHNRHVAKLYASTSECVACRHAESSISTEVNGRTRMYDIIYIITCIIQLHSCKSIRYICSVYQESNIILLETHFLVHVTMNGVSPMLCLLVVPW